MNEFNLERERARERERERLMKKPKRITPRNQYVTMIPPLSQRNDLRYEEKVTPL